MDNLENVVSRLKGMKTVKAAILFGSYAKGRQRKDSDIDICVISDTTKPLELSSEKFDISLFDRLPNTIKYRVFKDGKVLFSKDDKLLNKLKFWAVKIYLDEKHWRDRFVQKVLS